MRIHRSLAAGLLAILALGNTMTDARAQSTPPDQVQEDWQLILATPDPTGGGPQISTLLSPVIDGSTPFFVFNLNYRETPSYSPGGIEIQVWQGDQMLSGSTKGTAQCSTAGETITWTQTMKISSGVISFAIDSGKSTTWGKFGQGNQLNVTSSFTTSLTSLSQYSPTTTVNNSGVGWEPNRVTSMKLLQVRYYAGGKLLSTDSTVRTISLSN
jgi:hypothetical protein